MAQTTCDAFDRPIGRQLEDAERLLRRETPKEPQAHPEPKGPVMDPNVLQWWSTR